MESPWREIGRPRVMRIAAIRRAAVESGAGFFAPTFSVTFPVKFLAVWESDFLRWKDSCRADASFPNAPGIRHHRIKHCRSRQLSNDLARNLRLKFLVGRNSFTRASTPYTGRKSAPLVQNSHFSPSLDQSAGMR